jgi:hypothetical protein
MKPLPEAGQQVPRFNAYKVEPVERCTQRGVPARVFWRPEFGMVVVCESSRRAA